MEEKKTCENCLYYLSIDKWCINYNPYSPSPLIPTERSEACDCWVSREKGDDEGARTEIAAKK